MYICLCKGITDSQIRAAVDQGADSITKLQKKIGIAQSCGSCVETVSYTHLTLPTILLV